MEIEVIDSGEVVTVEVVDTALNQVQSDWNQTDNTAVDYIKNKPQSSTQIQTDWNQTDDQKVDYIKNKPELTKENIPGLKTSDSPEFADNIITGLKSNAGAGGEIPAAQYNWFKGIYSALVDSSVKSWIIGIVTYVKDLSPQSDITFSGSIDLTKVDTHYNNYAQTGILGITIAANSIVGGSAEIQITANGSAITVTGATQYGDTAIDYTSGKINHFLFTKFSNGIYYSVKHLN